MHLEKYSELFIIYCQLFGEFVPRVFGRRRRRILRLFVYNVVYLFVVPPGLHDVNHCYHHRRRRKTVDVIFISGIKRAFFDLCFFRFLRYFSRFLAPFRPNRSFKSSRVQTQPPKDNHLKNLFTNLQSL